MVEVENVKEIKNPHRRVVKDLKIRNKGNEKTVAGEYFGSKFTYEETFKMFNDYKKAFLNLDGVKEKPIIISAPSTIATVNTFYGAIDADKIAVPVGPGFLHAFTNRFTKEIGAETAIIFDGFINEELIEKLKKAGVKNVIITSITDYMHPYVKEIGAKKGLINAKDFLDEYIKSGKKLPSNINFIRLEEFAEIGKNITNETEFPYQENKIAAHFLTGATTSKIPKGVKVYADSLTKMAQIYDQAWFDFKPGDRNTVFIPIFYATGAIHGIHAGLFSGFTNIYQPKYDRFAFGKDLAETKANIALVAPSHIATLEESGLADNSLEHVKYVFIGGEAVTPAQMKKYRENAKRLGIKYILNGYGMTETSSMTGVSDKEGSIDDVTISPVPGVKYRIVDPTTREELSDNQRGILEKYSPCETAGYTDEALNKQLFTSDHWINTGDVAIRYSNGKYRVFGRNSDYFTNQNNHYAMFDIEEEILKHPGISEAEVIKFSINNEEHPAIVVVVKQEWKDKLKEILSYISNLKTPGIDLLIGTRFITHFNTNEVTAKRDYLSLPEFKDGYYILDNKSPLVLQTDIDNFGRINRYPITDSEIIIRENNILIRERK